MPLTAYDPDTGRIILPGSAAHNARCADCARLVAHSEGRLKCDAFWTPSPATDINPTWAACSVWQPRKDI
jgi:hypothetical protein